MDAVISLKNPVCTVCNITVKSLEMLNLHMKNIHQESPHDRMNRVTDTVKSALQQESIKRNTEQNVPSFDCTECGEIFKTNQDQNSYNQKVHSSGLIPNVILAKKPDIKEQITCELCDKIFNRPGVAGAVL